MSDLKKEQNIAILSYPLLLVEAQSNNLCIALTPSLPMGATSPPVIMAKSIPE